MAIDLLKMRSCMEHTLRLEHFISGRTRLQSIHCPDGVISEQILSINTYECGELTVDTGDQAVRVPEGYGVLLPARVPCKLTNHHPGKTISLWNQLRFSIMETIDPFSLLVMPIVIDISYGSRVKAINREIRELEESEDTHFLTHFVKRQSLAIQLFEIILEVSELKPEADTFLQHTERLQPALQFIKGNLSAKICTEELASILHVSEPRLFEIFREVLGVSPGKYVQQQRMQKAQELLVNSGLRVAEVGMSIGYADQFHFSRLFKNHFGVSPALFRKQWS